MQSLGGDWHRLVDQESPTRERLILNNVYKRKERRHCPVAHIRLNTQPACGRLAHYALRENRRRTQARELLHEQS